MIPAQVSFSRIKHRIPIRHLTIPVVGHASPVLIRRLTTITASSIRSTSHPFSPLVSDRRIHPNTQPFARDFSLSATWQQTSKPKEADPVESKVEDPKTEESTVKDPPEGEAGKDQKPNPEESSSSDSAKEEGKEDGKDDAGEKKAPPPPPPHGDKTPWQVFMETLQTEFKASKEWNDSTKALQSGYQEFTTNPTLQKAKSAYDEASKTASSTTSAAFKTTGKAIGQSAAWAWETPVAKVIRKGAEVTGTGLEKATRPVRETEAFKSVKNVIDDGSSSRYGGWIEKEERRRRRALRDEKMLKDGKPIVPLEENPE
jgi:import inner membrane translocase subunit TIM44